jgi:hypothetical protein
VKTALVVLSCPLYAPGPLVGASCPIMTSRYTGESETILLPQRNGFGAALERACGDELTSKARGAFFHTASSSQEGQCLFSRGGRMQRKGPRVCIKRRPCCYCLFARSASSCRRSFRFSDRRAFRARNSVVRSDSTGPSCPPGNCRDCTHVSISPGTASTLDFVPCFVLRTGNPNSRSHL